MNQQVTRIGQEWVEGKFPKGFEVLDIGAGSNPSPGTTRAIDIQKPKKLRKCKSLKEYKVADAGNIPYKDKFFDRAISRWAIGPRIKGEKVYKELARVIKPGGEVYISILKKDASYLPPVEAHLRRLGFSVLDIFTGTYQSPNRKDLEEFVIHARKEGVK